MIFDRLSNIRKYLGINGNLDLALNYIADNLESMPAEIELKGFDVRAFFNEYRQTVHGLRKSSPPPVQSGIH